MPECPRFARGARKQCPHYVPFLVHQYTAAEIQSNEPSQASLPMPLSSPSSTVKRGEVAMRQQTRRNCSLAVERLKQRQFQALGRENHVP